MPESSSLGARLLPNVLTLTRIALTPFTALAILNQQFGQALVLFFVAGISDALDGFIARALGETSNLGAYLDPVADKLLLATIYICLGYIGKIPAWMVAVVFGRDLLILGMVAWGLMFTSYRKFPPTIWGKLSTLGQIVAVLVVTAAAYGLPSPAGTALWLMIVLTAWSGLHYAWVGLSMLKSIDGAGARG